MTTAENTHVVFIHLDLGIGGAESLVLNLAKATLPTKTDDNDDADNNNNTRSSSSSTSSSSSVGSIAIYTTHCSPTHCYDEVRPPTGSLSSYVRVRGSWIPRNFFGLGGTALCSALRMLYLTYIAARENPTAHVFVIDVLPTGVPYLVEYCNIAAGVLFYCHFPDKLLTRDTVNGEQTKNNHEINHSNGQNNNNKIATSFQIIIQSLRWLKYLYRWLIDATEEWSLSYSDLIVVNSHFTRGELERVFPSLFSLRNSNEPTRSNPSNYSCDDRVRVLYPSIDSSLSTTVRKTNPTNRKNVQNNYASTGPIVSLNRFERKKNVALVLHAYDVLLDRNKREEDKHSHSHNYFHLPPLIIAGGYDPLNVENVEYFCELRNLADEILDRYNLSRSIVCSPSKSSSVVDDLLLEDTTMKKHGPCIVFLPSISDDKRTILLSNASVWCYTPHREHFGIVPLEAMNAGVPVVAIRSGGPMETIVDGITGYLIDYSTNDIGTPRENSTVVGFADAIYKLLSNPHMAEVMGQRGKERVDEAFGMETFRRQWICLLSEVRDRGTRRYHRRCASYPSLMRSTMRTLGDLGWAIVLALLLTWALRCFGILYPEKVIVSTSR